LSIDWFGRICLTKDLYGTKSDQLTNVRYAAKAY
jgi:hypothetical protein